MLKRPITGSPLRRQSASGGLRGAPQPSQRLGYSSRPLRPLAPKPQGAQLLGGKLTSKRLTSQATDISQLEVVTAQQFGAVPVPPGMVSMPPGVVSMPPELPRTFTMPIVHEHPPITRGFPNCEYAAWWNNTSPSINVLSTAPTGDM